MKLSVLFSIYFFASSSYTQTAIIAHKSHSGTVVDFFIDPSTNFGEPGPQLIQLVRLNDSTYINVYAEFSGMIYHDTVRKNHPYSYYKDDVDSIYQREYYRHVEYINLKNSRDTGQIKVPSLQLQKMIESTPKKSENNAPSQEPSPKKKKRSYLLFLFGITGGGLLILRLFRKPAVLQTTS